MVHWNSSPHPISDIQDWSEVERLELRPDFQRKGVWSASARIMLMDTILRGVPMPKIFSANTIRDNKTYRIIIDGQQRISAILDFLRDGFSLDFPYSGDEKGKIFSELNKKTKDRFLSYQIDFNEAVNPTNEETREVYARVNKYTVPLNKQELRRADFPGDFLNTVEKLALMPFFDEARIFTPANRRRYGDVEYISELLAAMISGIQDKKTTLDDFYTKYADWDEDHQSRIINRFNKVLEEIELIFDHCLKIPETRFRQKADFYTLFTVVDQLISEGHTITGKEMKHLQKDFDLLQDHILPEESGIEICREYAIKCVSQANSASSRRWRHDFLKPILAGTYIGTLPDNTGNNIFYRIMDNISIAKRGPYPVCPICNSKISDNLNDFVLAWSQATDEKQMSNANWTHKTCLAGQDKWIFAERPSK